MKGHITGSRQFKKDRFELMQNITRETANAFLRKYAAYTGRPYPEDDSEVALIMAHKMRLTIGTAIQINESRAWLTKHGYSDTIRVDPRFDSRTVP